MGMFHSAVGWSQFLRQQNYYWREKLWRLHEDLLFICSFGPHFAILHMVSMTSGSFRTKRRLSTLKTSTALPPPLGRLCNDNLVIYCLRNCYTKSLRSSCSPCQGRCALCRCSSPKPGSTASLPPANKQLVSEQF